MISTLVHLLLCVLLCSEDVREARLFLDSLGMTHTKVLAKVETRQALLNFRGILGAADGIVMSRWALTL
jgi:pyruvate kinase